jgi:hypothetical protein
MPTLHNYIAIGFVRRDDRGLNPPRASSARGTDHTREQEKNSRSFDPPPTSLVEEIPGGVSGARPSESREIPAHGRGWRCSLGSGATDDLGRHELPRARDLFARPPASPNCQGTVRPSLHHYNRNWVGGRPAISTKIQDHIPLARARTSPQASSHVGWTSPTNTEGWWAMPTRHD